MKFTAWLGLTFLSASLLPSCTTASAVSSTDPRAREHQVRANNLQALNAGRSATLAGD